jgi:hypothetical protein
VECGRLAPALPLAAACRRFDFFCPDLNTKLRREPLDKLGINGAMPPAGKQPPYKKQGRWSVLGVDMECGGHRLRSDESYEALAK